MSFQDHFSALARDYSRYRPRYPEALFEWLASRSPRSLLACDVATGNGQAAIALAERFDRVIAIDASMDQLRSSTAHPRVVYARAASEAMPAHDGRIDLVTVAQAAHWFELDQFFAEVRRALRPGGLVALWSYAAFECDPDVDEVVRMLDHEIINRHWPARTEHTRSLYRNLIVPFPEIPTPSFTMEVSWSLGQVLGFLNSWSGVRAYERAHGENPIERVLHKLEEAWGEPDDERLVRWPVGLRVGIR